MTRLSYDLTGLRELRANNWYPCGIWITISAQDAAGNRIAITTTLPTSRRHNAYQERCRML